jgi:hypothetical protein
MGVIHTSFKKEECNLLYFNQYVQLLNPNYFFVHNIVIELLYHAWLCFVIKDSTCTLQNKKEHSFEILILNILSKVMSISNIRITRG